MATHDAKTAGLTGPQAFVVAQMRRGWLLERTALGRHLLTMRGQYDAIVHKATAAALLKRGVITVVADGLRIVYGLADAPLPNQGE